eukprot:792638-Pelagomonas_calceolata.AAC.1
MLAAAAVAAASGSACSLALHTCNILVHLTHGKVVWGVGFGGPQRHVAKARAAGHVGGCGEEST